MTAAVPGDAEDFVAAREIARELADRAVWSNGVCAFHGATAPPALGQPAVYRSFGGDLYEGSAGVARFLACAARLSGEAGLEATALGAAAHALARADGWSLFSGGVGIGLAVLETAEWLEAPALVQPAVALIERASDAALRASVAAPADLLAGLAGAVIGLVAAEPYDIDGGWRRRALALGDALLAQGSAQGAGLAWPLYPGGGVHLCGLAHGASGVALALESLAELDPSRTDWVTAARRARDFERGWYLPERGSWADLRGEPATYPHMWCHGSVGVAAERLRADPSDVLAGGDRVAALAAVRAEAEALIAGPRGPGAGDAINGSQCHGLGGMSDLFVDAWLRDRDPEWLALARACTAAMREDATRPGGWRCGVPGGETTPGLMLGLAGIGWAQLRAARPEDAPCAWRPRCGMNGRYRG